MEFEEEEGLYRMSNKQRRGVLYGSFLCALLGASLGGAALGTQKWFQADILNTQDSSFKGHFNAGLFKGSSLLETYAKNSYAYTTVCGSGRCMWSCAATAEGRHQQLEAVLAGDPDAAPPCKALADAETKGRTKQLTAGDGAKAPLKVLIEARHKGHLPTKDEESSAVDVDDVPTTTPTGDPTTSTDPSTSTSDPPHTAKPDVDPKSGLINTGLWGATIGLVAAGVALAAVAAVFAIVNTATTPVEAISGVPGLYLWNGLAAGMQVLGAVCWGAHHATALSANVLVLDAAEGWTTRGQERLGYSFWLVVVAAVVHLGNIALIAFGTYEPKVKEKIQEPDKATNDILLY